MKQLAVEFLVQELKENSFSHLDLATDIIDKAKEMEKQQIVDAYNENENYMCDGTEAEQYYNETFKK
jgi:vacuolar-type H+-ATPase subunit H